MSIELREKILTYVAQELKGKDYIEDKDIADELKAPIREIQTQLEILEVQGFVKLIITFGPTYAVEITPSGSLFLEQVQAQKPETRRPIGFEHS